jgi:hypothetical protein
MRPLLIELLGLVGVHGEFVRALVLGIALGTPVLSVFLMAALGRRLWVQNHHFAPHFSSPETAVFAFLTASQQRAKPHQKCQPSPWRVSTMEPGIMSINFSEGKQTGWGSNHLQMTSGNHFA